MLYDVRCDDVIKRRIRPDDSGHASAVPNDIVNRDNLVEMFADVMVILVLLAQLLRAHVIDIEDSAIVFASGGPSRIPVETPRFGDIDRS